MLERLKTGYRSLRRGARQWLQGYPRIRRGLEITGCLRPGAEAAARGVVVGLFIGLTPTVGFQTLLMIVACMLLRGNFIVAFAVSWVSNPLTIGVLYWFFHLLGERLFELLAVPVEGSSLWFLQGPGDDMFVTVTGSLLIAIPVSLAGYLVSHRISTAIALRRQSRDSRPSLDW